MFLAFVIVIFIISIIWFVKRITFKPSKSVADAETSNTLESIKTKISNTSDPLKKKILENHLGHIIQQDANKRLKPLMYKWAKKVEKYPTPKNEEQFHIYEKQYNSAIAESKSLMFNIDDELSDVEKKVYADFCESFRTFRSCSKVWKILSSVRNTEFKSSAYASFQRESTTLKTEIFDVLSFSNDVPTFPISYDMSVYFYPKFIVEGKNIFDFDVLPINSVNIVYKPTRFMEDDIRPADAKQVDSTYRYINKDGSPDRRYSYNPIMPVFLYGDITLEPYGNTFQVSNNDAAMNMYLAFKTWKSSCASVNAAPYLIKTIHPTQKRPYTQTEGHILDFHPDPLLKEAATFFVQTQSVSAAMIQREFKIGFSRAIRIIMQLEVLGIISHIEENSPREVLIKNIPDLDNILNLKYTIPDNSAQTAK